MPVRAITPRVTAISGHVQIHCDADGYDLEQDNRWNEVDPSGFYPDPSIDDFRRGSNGQRARGARSVATPMNAVPGHTAGCHRRPGTATSFPSVGARGGAGESTEPPGGGLVGSPTGPRARTEPSSSPGARAGTSPLEDVRRPGGHRDAS